MSDRIVAVIGHVDHGKTALVKALTGIETDRLKEECERGLSITLGFAHLERNSAICHLVDTPGHVDFIRATASGLSGADVILLVVSSADGVAIQTREYLKMARLFGLSHCVVALSQSDRASPRQIEQVQSDTKTLLLENEMTAIAIVPCSAVTGENIERLRASLFQFSDLTSNLMRPDEPYLPIDRVFSVAGAGTVVTGSLIGGHLETGCEIRVTPSNTIATVRAIEVIGRKRISIAAANRVAVNLRGLDLEHIERGDVLCSTHFHAPSHILDVGLMPASKMHSELKHMEQIQLLIGARAISARVRLLGRSETETRPSVSFAQLELGVPHIAYRGQRAVIRRPASGELVAGAVVLDPVASKVTRNKTTHMAVLNAATDPSPMNVVKALARRDRGCVSVMEFERLSGCSLSDIRQDLHAQYFVDDGPLIFERAAQADLETLMCDTLERLQLDRPLRPYVPIQDLRKMVSHAPAPLISAAQAALKARGVLGQDSANVWLEKFANMESISADARSRLVAAEAVLKARGLAPENVKFDNIDDEEAIDIEERLIWMGRAVRLYNIGLKQSVVLHSEVVTSACAILHETFGEAQAFTTSEARQILRTNRKIIVPLLEHFDRLGVTSRRENLRWMVACSRL